MILYLCTYILFQLATYLIYGTCLLFSYFHPKIPTYIPTIFICLEQHFMSGCSFIWLVVAYVWDSQPSQYILPSLPSFPVLFFVPSLTPEYIVLYQYSTVTSCRENAIAQIEGFSSLSCLVPSRAWYGPKSRNNHHQVFAYLVIYEDSIRRAHKVMILENASSVLWNIMFCLCLLEPPSRLHKQCLAINN